MTTDIELPDGWTENTDFTKEGASVSYEKDAPALNGCIIVCYGTESGWCWLGLTLPELLHIDSADGFKDATGAMVAADEWMATP